MVLGVRVSRTGCGHLGGTISCALRALPIPRARHTVTTQRPPACPPPWSTPLCPLIPTTTPCRNLHCVTSGSLSHCECPWPPPIPVHPQSPNMSPLPRAPGQCCHHPLHSLEQGQRPEQAGLSSLTSQAGPDSWRCQGEGYGHSSTVQQGKGPSGEESGPWICPLTLRTTDQGPTSLATDSHPGITHSPQ